MERPSQGSEPSNSAYFPLILLISYIPLLFYDQFLSFAYPSARRCLLAEQRKVGATAAAQVAAAGHIIRIVEFK
eukprot:1327147-Amorphochlora_amoeboformis.AAC.1